MHHIVRGRQQGKTYDLLKWAEQDPNRVVLFANHERARYADQMAKKEGIQLFGNQLEVVKRGIQSRGGNQFAIDDLDEVLYTLLGVHVSVVSDTGSSVGTTSPKRSSIKDPLQQSLPTSGDAIREYEKKVQELLYRDFYQSHRAWQQAMNQIGSPSLTSTPTSTTSNGSVAWGSHTYGGVCLGGPSAGEEWVTQLPYFEVVTTGGEAWKQAQEGIAYPDATDKYTYHFMAWDTKTVVGKLHFWAALEDHAYWKWKLEPYIDFFIYLANPPAQDPGSWTVVPGTWGVNDPVTDKGKGVKGPKPKSITLDEIKDYAKKMGNHPRFEAFHDPLTHEINIANKDDQKTIYTFTEEAWRNMVTLPKEEEDHLSLHAFVKPPLQKVFPDVSVKPVVEPKPKKKKRRRG